MGLIPKLSRRYMSWALAWKAARWLYAQGRERLARLEPDERRDFFALMRKSRGRASNLTQRDKERLKAIVKRALF